MDLAPDEMRLDLAAKLAKKVQSNDTRMSTGFLGTRPILPVLTSCGQNDLAVRLFQSRRFPSWGYEIEQGATTIWERWNSYTKDKGFGGEQNASMNSFAHYSFGAVCEWMFSKLTGIDTDGAGYKRTIIRPMPPSPDSNPEQKPIDWVRAHYDSVHGKIVSAWKRDAARFELEVTIPPNTTATVFMPAKDVASVTEGGNPIERSTGVKFVKMEGDRAVLSVESGSYHFVAKL
jgi:alpha-L-rhamnosidase